jgi:hypothetical protein
MALAPQYYEEAQLEAPIHVIMSDIRLTPTTGTMPRVIVEGTISTIFKGEELVALGDRVAFEVTAGKRDLPIPGDMTIYSESLEGATTLEAYFAGTPPHLNTVLGMVWVRSWKH